MLYLYMEFYNYFFSSKKNVDKFWIILEAVNSPVSTGCVCWVANVYLNFYENLSCLVNEPGEEKL